MSNTFDKLSVLDSFIGEVDSYLPEIEANFGRLAQSPGDMEALEETYRRTHTIGGSASMMDFPGLAHVAQGMEDILGDILDEVSPLNAPTLALLQRSLGRLRQLLTGISKGVDENAVIAEDDADYARYRAMMQTAAQSRLNEGVNTADSSTQQSVAAAVPPMTSLDEVLASFRTPTVVDGEEIAWPEEPILTPSSSSQVELPPASISYEAQGSQYDRRTGLAPAQPSALDMLVATTRQAPQPAQELSPSLFIPLTPASSASKEPLPPDSSFLQTYRDMQMEADALKTQAASLKQILAQLRSASSLIEGQRSEFKGFLDGSKDALDRMEEWAGRAMGLNLRNSPEQVRRYLPLSVMWVANSKMKKVLDLLVAITNGVEMTDEQMHHLLSQLQTSISACGEAFQELLAEASNGSPQSAWSPWERQVSYENATLQERVTFERRGDPALLRVELEAQLRKEIQQEYEARLASLASRAELEQQIRQEVRREYETRPLTLAARAELEQQIRLEIRQEYEAKRQLQDHLVGAVEHESLQGIEDRLRNELEIQVRQEFLSHLAASGNVGVGGASPAQTLMPPASAAPRTSNFLDQAQVATGIAANSALTVPEPTEQTASSTPLMTAQFAPAPVSAPTRSMAPSSTPALGAPKKPATTISTTSFNSDFGEEAAEIFRLEAEEHLQTISVHVAALEKSPENRDLIQAIRRATHTLKGAASMMGFRLIADLSHVFEDLLESIMEGKTTISSSVLSVILDTAETLDLLISNKETFHGKDEAKVQALRVRYFELLGEQSTILGTVEIAEDFDAGLDTEGAIDERTASTSSVTGVVAGIDGQARETHAQRAVRRDLSVRVRLQKLDELVNLFGELLVNRSILEERLGRLNRLVVDVSVSSNRLRDVGQRLESRFEAATLPSGRSVQVMPGEGTQMGLRLPSNGKNGTGNSNTNRAMRIGSAHIEEFDELELDRYTEFHQLARGLSETVSDMTTLSTEMDGIIRECESVFGRENRLSTTFQDRLMKARLVPLSTMTPRLYSAARAVALKQNKDFNFLLEGEQTEVDRTVYEEIFGPLLHLVRNAANHALETPEVRIQKGKPPVGQIKLSAGYEGNQVVITVRDDGVGIEPELIRNAAIARGLVRPDQVLQDSDLLDLIFRPGFSTSEVLSEESGRGVGLDVVRDSVSRLRGTLEVESTPGQGTAFTMRFPTSLAIQSAMMVRVGGQQFAIPTVMIESIGRLDNYKRSLFAGQPAIAVQNRVYPLRALAQFLNLSVGSIEPKAPLLLINTGGRRVALVVDEIKGKLDVVMKNLGPHLRHVHGIAGGTVLGNGRVVLILELIELLAAQPKFMGSVATSTVVSSPTQRDSSGAISVPQAIAASRSDIVTSPSMQTGPIAKIPTAIPAVTAERANRILVVDDSPSVRRVVGNMLKQNGWEVQMARDGVEALDLITHEMPAAVLLDIEMPRMDGYELMATVRAQEQYRALPLIVLTSRAATKHQQRATQLGASAYVIKPYQDEELLSTLNALVYGVPGR